MTKGEFFDLGEDNWKEGILFLLVIGIMFFLGYKANESVNQDAVRLWTKVEQICDLTESDPTMEEVILPNGNIGFNIKCEQK